MKDVQWWSQPTPPEGTIASRGILRQLGRPALDPLTVLVRETAQNSCDAAMGGDIDFSMQLTRLSGNRLNAWRDFLQPAPEGLADAVDRVLSEDPDVLTVSDRGTTGLGGPVRADTPAAPGERPDFVNFIRNVGERKNVANSGGSYGFGKGILYSLSRCHLIVTDTVCMYEGRRQHRLIASALGDTFENDGVMHTGRHWLGVADDDGVPMPLLDADADEVSRALGLPRFTDDATGTTIVVIGIDLGRDGGGQERTPEDGAVFLASSMLWHLWPRMLPEQENRLRCSVKYNGFPIEVPDPTETPEIEPFVSSFRELRDAGDHRVPVRRTPPKEIGRLAIRRELAPIHDPDPRVSAAAPFKGRARHCARMRQAELVVDYVQGEPLANEMLHYGGVFRSSEEADPYFADAEPPTHDAWVTDGLTGRALGVVRLANRSIRDEMDEVAMGASQGTRGSADRPLGKLAKDLSFLVAGAALPDNDDPARPESSATARSSRKPSVTGTPALRLEDGHPVIVADVTVPGSFSEGDITAIAHVVTESGLEPGPDIRSWVSDSGETHPGPTIRITPKSSRRWTVRVHPTPDTVTRISVKVEAGR